MTITLEQLAARFRGHLAVMDAYPDIRQSPSECAGLRQSVEAAPTIIEALIAEVEALRLIIEENARTAARQQEALVEERAAVLELQREACARDGVPMPSERPLVDKLRAMLDRIGLMVTDKHIAPWARLDGIAEILSETEPRAALEKPT